MQTATISSSSCCGTVCLVRPQRCNGQLGDGTQFTQRLAPTLVSGGLAFTSLTAGDNYTCGLTSAGAAYC